MYIKMYLIGLPLNPHVLFYLRVNICSPRASSNLTSFGFHNQGPPNFWGGKKDMNTSKQGSEV